MADDGESHILKILSGLQYGVEVGLGPGTYSFGNAADADIQFADVMLQPMHGRIRVGAGKLELRSDGGAITTSSGLNLSGRSEWHEVAQLDVISAGTTRFAVGGRGAKWASLASAERGAPSAQGVARPRERRANGLSLGVLGVGLVALLGGGAMYLAGGSGQFATPLQQPRADPVDVLRAAIDRLPFEHRLTVTQAVDGTLEVAGFVQAAVERRAAQNAIAETRIQTRSRIWVRDAMENEIAAFIASQGVNVDFELSPDGELRLEGDVLDPEAVRQLVDLIQAEVFGLAGIDDRIRTAQTILGEVNGVLESARLRDLVILRLDGMLIEATGVVPRNRIDNWVGFIQVYARRYADILPLRSFVTLEGVEGSGDPIVIGAGGEGLGRLVPRDTFGPDALPQEADLFALPEPDMRNPAPNTAPAAQSGPLTVSAAETAQRVMTLLRDRRPDLASTIDEALRSGTAPTEPVLLEALGVLAGEVSLRPSPQGPQLRVNLGDGRSTDIAIGDFLGGLGELADTVAEVDPDQNGAGAQTAAQPAGAALGGAGQRLAALFEPSANGDGNPPVGDADAGSATAPAGNSGRARPAGASQAGDTLADPGPHGAGALAGAEAVLPASFQPEAGDDLLIRAAERLAEQDDGTVRLPGETLALARRQQTRLSFGETLIVPPAPMAATSGGSRADSPCAIGPAVSVEMLPTILLWLDVLSLDPELDFGAMAAPARPALMQAALSPGRLSACLAMIDTAYSRALIDASVFLAEHRRNEDFGRFMFRATPGFELDVTGAHLIGERYVQTVDGRKLREGAAPTLASRIETIGDLGILVRVSDAYRVRLFDEALTWRVAEF